jgi:hypothetical protein
MAGMLPQGRRSAAIPLGRLAVSRDLSTGEGAGSESPCTEQKACKHNGAAFTA